MSDLDPFFIEIRAGKAGEQIVSLSCHIKPELKQPLSDHHHNIDGGLRRLDRVLQLLRHEHSLNPDGSTTYLKSIEKSVEELQPAVHILSTFIHAVRNEIANKPAHPSNVSQSDHVTENPEVT